ncbi:MAG: TonB C-terminal domain-containing protein [Candidatus Omnitrophica bacterium]|nr:TonB C-terminal domain-containing protein [Candidatus Omnitrophota bacterium]
MNRLQKKYLLVSASLHLLLLSVLFVGPAFVAPKPPPVNDLPILDIIPSKLVDDLLYGGGARGAPPPAPRTVQSEPARPAAPPRVTRPPARKAAPAEPAPTPDDEIPSEPPETRTSPRHVITPNLKPVARSTGNHSATERRRAEAAVRQEAETAAWQNRVGKVMGAIQSGLSGNVTIESFGEGAGGTGGEAYANYAQAIKSIYDHAWFDPPADVTDESLNVQVRIVLRRDGTVVSARIVDPSGNRALDQSVRRALDRVDSVPPFPEGAKEDERTYTINFNLRSKRING